MRCRFTILVLFTGAVLTASDFQTGQAARAVLGQPSFSARDKGVSARALSISNGILYAADVAGRLLGFDLSRVGASKTTCPVCIAAPQSSVPQAVFEGVAAAAVYGNTIAIADTASNRVTIWRGSTPKPDVVLTGFSHPVSVALDAKRLYVGDSGSHHVYIWNGLPTGDKAPDVILGTAETSEGPAADTIQNPAALASDGSNLFIADPVSRRILMFAAADAAAPAVENAATLLPGPLAPLSLATLRNAAHGSSTVYLNGRPVKVTESTGLELQIQLPADIGGSGAGSILVTTQASDGSTTSSRPTAIRFAAAAPGIFAFGSKEPRTGLLLHAPEGVPLSPDNPAKPGQLLTVWATGLGAVSPDTNEEGAFDVLTPVRALVNGQAADVISAVLPGDATGIYEVRLRLPQALRRPAVLTIVQNELKSNPVTFPIKTP